METLLRGGDQMVTMTSLSSGFKSARATSHRDSSPLCAGCLPDAGPLRTRHDQAFWASINFKLVALSALPLAVFTILSINMLRLLRTLLRVGLIILARLHR